nr:hypothetical protein HK105_005467 [Polyrhizophydium stewartii]
MERLRVCQREKTELELRVSSLISELDEVRAEKEQLTLEAKQNERTFKRQLAEQLSEAKNLQAEKDSLLARLASVEQDLSHSMRRQDELTTENASLTKELDKTKSRLEQSVHEFNDMKLATLKERDDSNNQISQLKEKTVELKSSIKTLNGTIQDLRQKQSSSEKEFMERIRLAREEEWSKISALESEKSEEHDRLKKEIQELTAQQDALHAANRGLVAEKEHLQSECGHLQTRSQELDTQLSATSGNLEVYKRQSQTLSDKVASLEAALQSRTHDLETVQDQLDKEREAHMHNMERQKHALVQERFQFTQRIESLTKDNVQLVEKIQELDALLDQQRKLLEGKILTFKEKAKAYKAEAGTLRKSLEDEHKRSRRQLDEMRQRQQSFMTFLQTEGLREMDLIAAASRSDAVAMRRLLEGGGGGGGGNGGGSSGIDVNTASHEDGRTALHVATTVGSLACVEILLRQPTINIDAADNAGNTALHLAAACREVDVLRMLLSHGADLFVKNKAGNRASEYTQDTNIEMMLQERMTAARNAAQWKKTQLGQLESELPSDVGKLKELCVDLLINQNVFEERCKLIEEKHMAMYKNRLLEQAAGIPDRETGEKYLGQLQYWQDEIERQASTISYLKLRIQVLETTAAQQEEYYKHNLNELTRHQKEQIHAIFKRAEETERAFLAYQKKHSEELAKANQMRGEGGMKENDRGKVAPASEDELRQEVFQLRQQLDEAMAQRVTIEGRLKLIENLKSLAENEVNDLRSEIEKTRRNMTEKVMSQIEEGQQEQNKKDEKDESLGEIIFIKNDAGQKSVKAGTVDKLVERLLDPNTYDNQYVQAMLFTHTVYMDSKDLLEKVAKLCRDNIASAKAAATEGVAPQTSTPIILKAVNMVKYWIEQYWSDFQSNPVLMQLLNTFLDSLENPKLVQMIKTVINRKVNGVEAPVIEMPSQFPKPILPKVLIKRASTDMMAARETRTPDTATRPVSAPWNAFGKKSDMNIDDLKLKLADLDALEVARQLTLIEFELFNAIKARLCSPREFLDLAWMKDDKETRAPNIIRMVRWSNHVVHWLVSEIVAVKDNIKQRAAMMEKIIMVAQHLEKLNNFNGVKEVLAALQSSAVYRLKKTKELIGGKFIKIFEELKKLTSSELNYKLLRTKVHAVEPPLIPFPGVYQGDLVFLETCGKTKLEGGLVNFQKFQKITSYVLELQTYQQVPYQLGPVPEIQEFLRSFPVLDDDQAYGLSLQCEPR